MDLLPLPGTSGTQLIALLDGTLVALSNVRGGSGTGIELFNAYLSWSSDQVRMLGRALPQTALDSLITTRRHWALHSLDPSTKGNSLRGLVEVEIEQQMRVIEDALTRLREELRRFAGISRIVIPDTNVFLHTVCTFDLLDWDPIATPEHSRTLVVIPLLVIDELDKAKHSTRIVDESGPERVRSRARTTLRALEERLLPLDRFQMGGAVHFDLYRERPDHVRLHDPDSEIIDQAQGLRDFTGLPLAILTLDTGMRLRAELSGLETAEVPEPWTAFPPSIQQPKRTGRRGSHDPRRGEVSATS